MRSLPLPDRGEVRDYLDLRDWLRVSPEDRDLYAATKRRLARQRWGDMNDYAVAKTDVVLDILGRARAWRDGPGPGEGVCEPTVGE